MGVNDLGGNGSSSSSSSQSHAINSLMNGFSGWNDGVNNSSMLKHGSLNNSIYKEVKVGEFNVD